MVNDVYINWKIIKRATIICLIQHFEADIPKKVSLKILNLRIVLKTFPNAAKILSRLLI